MAIYYTAWVDSTETTFGVEHKVEDLSVYAFELVHQEGEFAELRLDIRNPRIGLLHASRKQWLWFSHNDEIATVTSLFFGRLVAVPQDLHQEIVRLTFIARPGSFDGLKRTLADSLRVLPYYDPMFFNEEAREEPDTALEARPELWHIDRTSLAVTTSNIVSGEDGTIDIGNGFFWDSLSISHSTPPLKTVRVKANIQWEQEARKTVDISPAFPAPIGSLTGWGLFNDWPKAGDDIGPDWVVASTDPGSREAFIQWTRTENGLPIQRPDSYFTKYIPWGYYTLASSVALFFLWKFKPTMSARFDVSRSYTETLEFDLDAGIQPLLVDAGDDDVVEISMAGRADELTDDGGSGSGGPVGMIMPIRDKAHRRYFPTARGQESIQFLIMLARTALLYRARAVDIQFEVSIENGFGLSCRKNVKIDDSRLPGGTATGKVKSYVLTLNGDTGEQFCQVLAGCTIGAGGTVSASAGTESYVESGYVAADYQHMIGAQFALLTDQVTYTDISDFEPNDDGLDLTNLNYNQVVDSLIVTNDFNAQHSAINAFARASGHAVANKLDEIPTRICLTMHEFDPGPFESTIALTVSELKVPKTLDLESGAS